MKNFKGFMGLVVLATIALALAVAPAEGSTETQAIVVENFQGTSISWQPQVNYDVATLTVASPTGNVFYDNFAAGINLFYQLVDQQGNILPDGRYTYELRLIKFIQQEGELTDDSDIPTQISVKNGAFSIQGGSLIPGEVGEVSIQTINPSGNYFTGNGGFSGNLCLGCGDNTTPDKELDISDISELFIRFDDTGSAVSTWDIGIPSESHKFIIKDVLNATTPFAIEESAATNALYVKGSVVGIGTSTPVDDVGGTSRGTLYIDSGANPAVILNQSANTLRAWQIFPSTGTGNLLFRDETAGEYRLAIATNGNVGIGTNNPSQLLHVEGRPGGSALLFKAATGTDAAVFIDVQDTSTDTPNLRLMKGGVTRWVISNNPADNSLRVAPTKNGSSFVMTSGGNVGIGTTNPGAYRLYVSGTAYSTGGWQSSDVRYKEGITPIEGALQKVMNMEGISYSWKTEEYKDMGFPEGRHYGVAAQEIEKVLPEVVAEGPSGEKAVSYTEIVPVLIEAVKEQQKVIAELSQEVKELRKELRLKGSLVMLDVKEQ